MLCRTDSTKACLWRTLRTVLSPQCGCVFLITLPVTMMRVPYYGGLLIICRPYDRDGERGDLWAIPTNLYDRIASFSEKSKGLSGRGF
jgi:hypothetical protein